MFCIGSAWSKWKSILFICISYAERSKPTWSWHANFVGNWTIIWHSMFSMTFGIFCLPASFSQINSIFVSYWCWMVPQALPDLYNKYGAAFSVAIISLLTTPNDADWPFVVSQMPAFSRHGSFGGVQIPKVYVLLVAVNSYFLPDNELKSNLELRTRKWFTVTVNIHRKRIQWQTHPKCVRGWYAKQFFTGSHAYGVSHKKRCMQPCRPRYSGVPRCGTTTIGTINWFWIVYNICGHTGCIPHACEYNWNRWPSCN